MHNCGRHDDAAGLSPHHDEPAAVEQDLAAAELGGEALAGEEALVDGVAGAIVEDALLPLLGLDVVAQRGVDDDELRGDAARLREKLARPV